MTSADRALLADVLAALQGAVYGQGWRRALERPCCRECSGFLPHAPTCADGALLARLKAMLERGETDADRLDNGALLRMIATLEDERDDYLARLRRIATWHKGGTAAFFPWDEALAGIEPEPAGSGGPPAAADGGAR